MTTLQVSVGQYTVSGSVGAEPALYRELIEHAKVHDDLGGDETEGTALILAASSASAAWPELVVSLRFSPGPSVGFEPGVHLVPETDRMLVGAGERLLAYDLRTPRLLREDRTDCGFWRWRQHGDVILMSAELELAAWSEDARRLWSMFVEPPWHYDVHGSEVHLDVMGQRSVFPAAAGPESVDAV